MLGFRQIMCPTIMLSLDEFASCETEQADMQALGKHCPIIVQPVRTKEITGSTNARRDH